MLHMWLAILYIDQSRILHIEGRTRAPRPPTSPRSHPPRTTRSVRRLDNWLASCARTQFESRRSFWHRASSLASLPRRSPLSGVTKPCYVRSSACASCRPNLVNTHIGRRGQFFLNRICTK